MADHADSRPRVVGTAEIARMLNVSRSRVHQLARRDDWPRPLERLESGAVWLRADVERWIAEHPKRRPGRPPKRRDS